MIPLPVKLVNVYDVTVGVDGELHKFVVFAPSEVAAAKYVAAHMRLPAPPESFDVSYVRHAKRIIINGTYAGIVTHAAREKELEGRLAEAVERMVTSESYVESYRAKLAAAMGIAKEAREMLPLIKAFAGPASEALTEALAHYDAVPLPTDLINDGLRTK